MYALVKARGRRIDRHHEWEYERLRIVVAALGSELPPYRRATPRPMSPEVINRQLRTMERRGIKVTRK